MRYHKINLGWLTYYKLTLVSTYFFFSYNYLSKMEKQISINMGHFWNFVKETGMQELAKVNVLEEEQGEGRPR